MQRYYFTLFFTLFFNNLAISQETKEIACSHLEVCHLAQELFLESNTKNIELKTAVNIVGDPHEYGPKMSEIKTLLKAPVLLAGPMELNPWIKKINYQRSKEQGLKTISLSLPDQLSKKYNNASKEVLAHFWLYPQAHCEVKNQMAKLLKAEEILPAAFSFDLNKCHQAAQEIENRLKQTFTENKYAIVLTHDALLPLIEMTKGKDGVVAIKGSGHHHETRPDAVKKLYDFLKGPKIIWIEETGINVPKNVMNKKRKDDLLIKIDTAKSNPAKSFSVLEELMEKVGELK